MKTKTIRVNEPKPEGVGFKFLHASCCTYYDGIAFPYPIPGPNEKWGPWFEHLYPAGPDGLPCGPGRIHIRLNLRVYFAPIGWWPWWVQWAGEISRDGPNLSVRSCRLRRITKKVFWRALRPPFNWGRGATLWKADLWSADLRNADLRGVNLRLADLAFADLHGADLRNAELWHANLHNANLRDANLQCANLLGANLWDAKLRNADLQSANLRNADLSNADLRGADLRGADLREADLRDANLANANLGGADRGGIKAAGPNRHSGWERRTHDDKTHVAR